LKDRQEQSGLTNKPISSKDRRHVAIGSVWAKAMLHVDPPQ
jgi:hypothetical protein